MPDAMDALPRPFDARMIAVGDGHWLYVEEVGLRGGRPCLYLHGGPGSGAQHQHRRLFDMSRDHAFLFDQRGAGRSHPYLSLEANTTQHLVADIEVLRAHFGIDKFLLVGGSWGATLALAYAQAYPERVSGIVLRAVFLGTHREAEWAFVDGPKVFRPELFAVFRDFLPAEERGAPLKAYLRRLLDPDPRVHVPAAHIWHAYERGLSVLEPGSTPIETIAMESSPVPPTPIMEAHYIAHDCFLDPGVLMENADRLRGIPGVIVQGRYDLLCPPRAAWALHGAWAGSRLTMIDGAGHAITEPGVEAAMKAAIASL